jgi:hypothetical protein
MLAQTEVERVKFIVRSCIRTRLFKVFTGTSLISHCRFDGLSGQRSGPNSQLDGLDSLLDGPDRQLGGRFDSLDGRLDGLMAELNSGMRRALTRGTSAVRRRI